MRPASFARLGNAASRASIYRLVPVQVGLTGRLPFTGLSNRCLQARAHCQVPCGIFDDPARVDGLAEDAATIRKAMVQVNELSTDLSAANINQASSRTLLLDPMRSLTHSTQATRWIVTKEEHASKIIATVSEYMLAQRVKPELFEDEAAYKDALVAHHKLMQAAVKGKQVVDVDACDALDAAIDAVKALPIY